MSRRAAPGRRRFLTTTVLAPSSMARSVGRPGNVTSRPAGVKTWFVGTTTRPAPCSPTTTGSSARDFDRISASTIGTTVKPVRS